MTSCPLTRRSIAIIGFNRPEWLIADLAAIVAGGVPAGIYTSSNSEQCHYIAEHSEASVAVVEYPEQLEKFLLVRDRQASQTSWRKLGKRLRKPGDLEGAERAFRCPIVFAALVAGLL